MENYVKKGGFCVCLCVRTRNGNTFSSLSFDFKERDISKNKWKLESQMCVFAVEIFTFPKIDVEKIYEFIRDITTLNIS